MNPKRTRIRSMFVSRNLTDVPSHPQSEVKRTAMKTALAFVRLNRHRDGMIIHREPGQSRSLTPGSHTITGYQQ